MMPEDKNPYFFRDSILPRLRELETVRKAVLNRLLFVAGCCASAAVLIFFATGKNPAALQAAFIIGALLLFSAYRMLTGNYVRDFKAQIISRLVKHVDSSLSYDPGRFISRETYMSSSIFQRTPDRYKGDDYIYGTIGETQIEFSEIHSEYKTQSRDSRGHTRTRWHTIFRGLFFIADFNKHFKGTTLVLPDTAERLFGFMGKKLQEIGFFRNKSLVSLEDPDFEKMFVVYSDDQIEARYILSPGLMRRILQYRQATDKTLHMSFSSSKVFIAVSYSKKLFEPRLFSSLLDFDMIAGYLEDIRTAVDIVESLNLNSRIWSK